MWYIVEERPEPNCALKYWLGGISGGGRTIGRKHVDVRLKASSVSRNHARLTVVKSSFYSPSHRKHPTSVSVLDSSAYGTFLKYPPGHSSNRDIAAHHQRLDKNTPTDVCEGALLAFGAPTAWWRVAWEPIACYHNRLSPFDTSRLENIAAMTSLELVDNWNDDVTHLVTRYCYPNSIKFLSAIVSGRHVVTPAWTEAVFQIVKEACKNIFEAPLDEIALQKTRLPDELLFLPPLSPDSLLSISEEAFALILTPERRKKRKNLFRGMVLAFATEDHRARIGHIIEALQGQTILSNAKPRPENRSVVHVAEDRKQSLMGGEFLWASESTVIEAILTATIAPLVRFIRRPVFIDVVDVATPAPDAESDVDSDESDAMNPAKEKQKESSLRSGGLVSSTIGVKRSLVQPESPRKRSHKMNRSDPDASGRGLEAITANPNERGSEHSGSLPPLLHPSLDQPSFDDSEINPRLHMSYGVVTLPTARSRTRPHGDVRAYRDKPP